MTNQVIVSCHLCWVTTNIHPAFKVTPMSNSLQDMEIQYRFSGFTTANLEINSYVVHGTKRNTLPVVHGLYVTVGPEKDTGTFIGPSFTIQKVWFWSLDTSRQTRYMFIPAMSGDHVSSATEAPLSRGWNLIHKNLLWLNNVLPLFFKSGNFSWIDNRNIYRTSNGTLLTRSKFFKRLAYDNKKNAFCVHLAFKIRIQRQRSLNWKIKNITSKTRSKMKWNL